MGLDEAWLSNYIPRAPNGRIEPLKMAHLKNTAIPFCRLDQAAGLLERVAYRLFHQHVDAFVQKLLPDGSVQCGGRRDAHRIHFAEEFPAIVERLNPERLRELLCSTWQGVYQSHQGRLGQRGVDAGVM